MNGALDENQIADHLEKYLMANDNASKTIVYSDMFRNGVHIYVFPPSKQLNRNYYTLVTMGMSGTRMKVPPDIENAEHYAHAELMCYLPPSWKLPTMLTGKPLSGAKETDGLAGLEAEDDSKNVSSWPFEMLRSLAGYVMDTGAWFGEGHGIPRIIDQGDGSHVCMHHEEGGESCTTNYHHYHHHHHHRRHYHRHHRISSSSKDPITSQWTLGWSIAQVDIPSHHPLDYIPT